MLTSHLVKRAFFSYLTLHGRKVVCWALPSKITLIGNLITPPIKPPRSHRAKGWWGESSAPTWANLTNQPLYRERTAPKVEFIIFSIKSIAWLHYYWLCTLTWHPGGKHRCTRLRTRPALTLTFTDTCTWNFSRKILVFIITLSFSKCGFAINFVSVASAEKKVRNFTSWSCEPRLLRFYSSDEHSESIRTGGQPLAVWTGRWNLSTGRPRVPPSAVSACIRHTRMSRLRMQNRCDATVWRRVKGVCCIRFVYAKGNRANWIDFLTSCSTEIYTF